ncbi:hypothetical protein B296_00004894 [Ensete ventricosum]|uniref:Bifunctional inhibitor/plant lipid transfer protein/seed storage helical domain-containing protein n=1 Tax=Ensete ventricosum TaxID=4639 RepID=A0A426ZAW6_ENSVE|nr:hypothetical protein B296_00004894 [Ensete ventricosum]
MCQTRTGSHPHAHESCNGSLPPPYKTLKNHHPKHHSPILSPIPNLAWREWLPRRRYHPPPQLSSSLSTSSSSPWSPQGPRAHLHRPRSHPTASGACPVDALKLGVCANVLDGLIHAKAGKPPKEPCCSLVDGLVDLEAAVCLCTAIKANVLGIHLNLPINLSLLLNYCGKQSPTGFKCA